jgi:ATP-dependent DNA helicase RecQ
MNMEKALQEYFGYKQFRKNQKEIISSIMDGNDTLALMPTGGGKSICYQLPMLVKEGLGIVISPLIALMKDQVDALKQNGVNAAYLNSSLSKEESNRIMNELLSENLKILYIAPEGLFGSDAYLFKLLAKIKINFVAVDEAHCISSWGHDFRPEYLRLKAFKQQYPQISIIALTATADDRTRLDILKNLNIEHANVFISSFNRENISYYVQPKKNSFDKLLDFLEEFKDESGIIYTLSRKSTESLSENLNVNGYSALPYHAGLSSEERERHQDLFIKDNIKIVVATIAFGMGIDKSNVRYVVHMDLPKNIESYYQETGRAGRDGVDSKAMLFFSRGDAIILRRFIDAGDQSQVKVLTSKLNKMIAFAESKKCRRQYLLQYFGEDFPDNCGSCDVCLADYKTFDGTVIAQKALSAVKRLNESFGRNYVIDFLRGSKSKKIREEHTWLKTYGVGADISKKNWESYLRNLIEDGYLRVTDDGFPVLKLTKKSMQVLYMGEKVNLIEEEKIVEKVKTSLDYDKTLFEQLRKVRAAIAREADVPPYIIFPDNTLIEFASYYPETPDDLLKMNGVGQVKANKYGDNFRKEINAYLKENNIDSKMPLLSGRVVKVRKQKTRAQKASPTKKQTYEMFKAGMTVTEIAEQRNLKMNSILTHLVHYVAIGELEVNKFVKLNKLDKILEAAQKHEGKGLREIKDELGDAFSYEEIKFSLGHKEFLQQNKS